MVSDARGDGFKIWGVDNVVYGPVELPTLVGWVKEERVTRDTWVYIEKDDAWRKTPDVPELQMFFREKSATPRPNKSKSNQNRTNTAQNQSNPNPLPNQYRVKPKHHQTKLIQNPT